MCKNLTKVEIEQIKKLRPDLPIWSHTLSAWIYCGEVIKEGHEATFKFSQDLMSYIDHIEMMMDINSSVV